MLRVLIQRFPWLRFPAPTQLAIWDFGASQKYTTNKIPPSPPATDKTLHLPTLPRGRRKGVHEGQCKKEKRAGHFETFVRGHAVVGSSRGDETSYGDGGLR
ncbi:hypothetical protein Nepgr_008923 [Nepenthes gracilis]|uniref:Uncharacterized protein n=1 Tax=Nepenthes gracilis TaxID=150966 RepID=A0AAD3S9J4_NEPGR|nr:hypothetical protein Nepgr_008923 [Nepenthes gracilis]